MTLGIAITGISVWWVRTTLKEGNKALEESQEENQQKQLKSQINDFDNNINNDIRHRHNRNFCLVGQNNP